MPVASGVQKGAASGWRPLDSDWLASFEQVVSQRPPDKMRDNTPDED